MTNSTFWQHGGVNTNPTIMEAMKSTQVLKVVNSVRLDNHDHMVSKDYDEKLCHLKYNLNFILVKNAR